MRHNGHFLCGKSYLWSLGLYAPTTEFQFRLELCVVKTPRFNLNLKPQDMTVHESSPYVSIGMDLNCEFLRNYVCKVVSDAILSTTFFLAENP